MRRPHKIYLTVYTLFCVFWFLFLLVWLRLVSPSQIVEMLPGLVDFVSAVILVFQQGPLTDVMSVYHHGTLL